MKRVKRVRAGTISRILGVLSSRDLLHSSGFFTGLNLGIGALVGGVIVSFIVLTEWLAGVVVDGEVLGAVRFAAPVLGALAAGFLLHRWFDEARGSGIPQTKAALVAKDGRIPFRVPFGKYLCGILTLGSGIPLGREGPSAQIGAGIASSVGEALKLDAEQRRQLVPVGTAAAIAAAFNTPIAAILFSLEEIVGDLHARVLGSVVLSAVASWLV
ncbi:MAG: chloride channel protein, partial [Acidobacteria bacterium]|nr:chloride channel protein [Acidobacteriota bacterium]